MKLMLQTPELQNFDIGDFCKSLMAFIDSTDNGGERQRLYLIVNELFSNAVEHGILKLDSALKQDSEGFIEYYQQREMRLHSQAEGHLKIWLHYQDHSTHKQLEMAIIDSGEGFDYRSLPARLDRDLAASGRGTTLVRALCDDFHYLHAGTQAQFTMKW